ncbi:MAG: hypothetical protein RML35_00820 [Chloroherpetonaceae bacterium]|nr:hypothetical protein [Chloroherpetonaceae bacterium]
MPDIIILDSGSGFVSPVTATFSHPLPQNVQIQVAVGTGGAISQLQFINTSTSQPANVPILSSSLEDPISTFPTISFLQNRFMIEEYQDSSLQRIANCINNGQPIDQKRVVISPDDSTSTTTGDVDVTNEFLSRPSQLVFVDLVTQALELPIATATNALFQETYQIQTTGKLGRFYFQAGQNNEPDWGAWGNLLSIKISESPIDPSFRKVQIFYKQEGEKKIVEEFEDSEQNVLSALKNSFYVQLVLHPTNTMNFLPFLPGVELFFYNGFDGTPQFQDYLGNPQQETGAYAFLGTPVTSMTCPDATDGFSNLTQQQILTIIDLYASLALSNNKTAIFALPRNISRNDIFNIYTRNFLKDRSNLILYRANGSVPDGRGGFINVPLVGHIHGAAYVRWRLSRSLFPNTIPKGDPTFLVGVFGLDKERYSQDEINDYVRNLGVNPVVLSSAGFIVEGARTMSRKNVHYLIHATELTNFYVESLIRFASFLKSEFNDETTQNRFAQRITDFTRILYDANCLDTEGGFNNNFQIKVDSSINPTSSRRKRIFNARIKIRWIEQIEAINIFFEKTDEGVSAQVG